VEPSESDYPDKPINRKLTYFQIGVENRDYHYLSQAEIGGAKAIYQHSVGTQAPSRRVASESHSVGAAVPSDHFDTETMNSVIGSGEY
jgi:hypothetical protein